VGAGNPNVYKTVKYGSEISKWHFIYFGYSRKEKRATGFVQFEGRKEKFDIPQTNHYLAKDFYFYVAKDKFYPAYNGKVGNLRLIFCDGAFNPEFPIEPKVPVTPLPPPPPPEPEPTCIEGSS
jgi:hypothetical protein